VPYLYKVIYKYNYMLPTSSPLGLLLSPELLEAIEELFPLRPPLLSDSDRQVWYKAGQHNVVEVLRAKFEEANDNPLSQRVLS
jgi:hypothetical protein